MAKKSDRVVPCLVHIPGLYPDGMEVEPETMECFMEMFDRQFGGSTPLGTVPGRWLDNEKTIEEPMHRIEVAVKKSELSLFKKTVKAIGRQTKQKVMYVVINYQAEVNFLYVDDEEESPVPPETDVDESDEDEDGESPPQAASK